MYYVYILANKKGGTLYVGVTNDLKKRVFQHKEKLTDGFTKEYDINKLVHFESTPDIYSAISYEKKLKKWLRQRKIDLIQKENVEWRDLYEEL